jgi:SAM-dependent methyltransferase
MSNDEKDPLNLLLSTIPNIVVPKGTNLEVECRFDIDERRKKQSDKFQLYDVATTQKLVCDIISHQLKSAARCEIEQSINFIKNNTHIKQIFFVNGEQQKSTHKHYHKEQLINPLTVISKPCYKINVAFEHTIKEFPINECQNARVRLRFSTWLSLHDKDSWRLDITLVKNIANFTNPLAIKEDKTATLYAIKPDNFIDKAPWNYVDHIEFEAEYVGDKAELTVESLKSIDTFMNSWLLIEKEDLAPSERSIATKSSMSDYQNKIYQIAKLIKPARANQFKERFGMKQLSNQVIELDKNSYLRDVAKVITSYYITDKLDGIRAIIYISKNEAFALTDKITTLKLDLLPEKIYVFDCEEYKDFYYIFDVMVWDGTIVTDQPFSTRLNYFAKAVELFSTVLKEKPFIKLNDSYKKQITVCKEEKKPYETDGIILTPADGKYETMQVYKYKPVDKLSVDFLIKKCPQKLIGIKPYIQDKNETLYLLFCGVQRNVFNKLSMSFVKHYPDMFPNINLRHPPDYFPIQFEPSDKKYAYLFTSDVDSLDNQVGEFVLEQTLHGGDDDEIKERSTIRDIHWKLVKMRTDRAVEIARGNYFGNNYKIAEIIWNNAQNPLVIEEIEDDASYFKEHESDIHKAQRNFNSFVKSQIFAHFAKSEWVMDMASGKGQDLFRYAMNGIKHVLFTEIDATALSELISRKHSFSTDQTKASMAIMTQQMNLLHNYKSNIEKLNQSGLSLPLNGFNVIICNFAFHYLIANRANLMNVLRFISHYLANGGRFIFTAFDGKAIVDLLKSGPFDHKPRYSIVKKYSKDSIELIGQKISVLLPFSSEEYYDEYLVNIDYIAEEAEKLGLTLEVDESFSKYLEIYKKNNYKAYSTLDDLDKQYVGLYHYYCLYKKKTK